MKLYAYNVFVFLQGYVVEGIIFVLKYIYIYIYCGFFGGNRHLDKDGTVALIILFLKIL